ncbi:MAG: calcium/sodium antiporter [Deltaproteobacteria bacterium]|nr:calcium/sodium antiporter [Deltaproteobacteria bacterium]MCK5709053.1 calcium/sodium antiporter [Deltaproteobacteria bacterium]
MSIALSILLFVVGLILLFLGGEGLVKGASRIARILGISPVVIGLTVVAFGTSAPEFVVGLIAALKGASDIVLGNIIGSNISNIGLILGIGALISPLVIQIRLIKVEVPIMIALSLILYGLAWSLNLGILQGIFLFGALIAFTIYTYFGSKKEPAQIEEEFEEYVGSGNSVWKQVAFIVLGLTGLVIGARLVVDSAIFIARIAGVSELVISITAVAIGTSLPELSTTIIAAIRKEHDIIVGNIIGSNIFNIGILGVVSMVHPVTVDSSLLRFEFPVMIFFSVLLLPLMITGKRVGRLEGLLLLALYAGFIYMVFR